MHPAWHLSKNILRSNLAAPAAPYKLTYAVTYRCNSRCTTCNIWQRPPGEELDLEEIESLFRRSPELTWIDMTGGEPFLRPDFVQLCAAALKHCPLYLLHFPTNGLLPARVEDGVKEILALKPHRLIVSVSIDGPREIHDKLRGGEGFFASAVETLRRLWPLQERRFRVYPGMTISRENAGRLRATVAALAAEVPGFRPEHLHVNIAQVAPNFYGNADMDTSFQADALTEIRDFVREKGRRFDGVHALERAYLKLAGRFVATGRTPLPCMAMSASGFLAPDGTLYPCTADEEPVGHVRDFGFSLREAWKSEAARRIRARLRAGRCRHCWTPCEAYQTLFSRLDTVLRCNLI